MAPRHQIPLTPGKLYTLKFDAKYHWWIESNHKYSWLRTSNNLIERDFVNIIMFIDNGNMYESDNWHTPLYTERYINFLYGGKIIQIYNENIKHFRLDWELA